MEYCMKKRHLVLLYVSQLLTTSIATYGSTSSIENEVIKNSCAKTICFTENNGQVADIQGNQRPDVLFTASGKGFNFYIRNSGISYVLVKTDDISEDALEDYQIKEKLNFYSHRIDIDFVGGNSDAVIEKSEKTAGFKNFYLPHCSAGITNVNSYNVLTRKNIYNNIDVRYTGGNEGGIKYDMIVNPGGKAEDIVLHYSGHDKLEIENGNLVFQTSLGELIESMPRVYQNINGKIYDVNAWYEITSEKNVIIKTGAYNKNYSLIIDPWISYFGGSSWEAGVAITNDAAGNIVFTGCTGSNNLPILNAYQSTLSSNFCIFVTKMNASGTLIWSTYYGGRESNEVSGVCTDKTTGDVYFTGVSSSSDFPTGAAPLQNCFMPTKPGAAAVYAAFTVKLNSSGARLWSTFYGNAGIIKSTDITTDQVGNVVFSGMTDAAINIATAGTFQPLNAGGTDAFVVKFSSTGTRLWGSYCGGSGNEHGMGTGACVSVSSDASNNIYITGPTTSADFPVTAGAHQTSRAGTGDAFLFKFNSAGQRVWATYYGGNRTEVAAEVKVDLNGDVYIGGSTNSSTGIASAGSFQPAITPPGPFSFPNDAYLAKFNSAGILLWATYAGGVGVEELSGIAIDNNNNVLIGGDTYSIDYPVSSCAYQTAYSGSEDQFITSFDASGNLICSGYIGGFTISYLDDETYVAGGAFSASNGFVYYTGFSYGAYPTTTGSFQPNFRGAGMMPDAVVGKLCFTTCGFSEIKAQLTANKTNVCSGDTTIFTLQNTSCDQKNTNYLWTFPGGVPTTSTSQHPTVQYTSNGLFDVKVVITTPCGTDSIIKPGYISVQTVSLTSTQTMTSCNTANGSATIIPSGGTNPYSYLWSNGLTQSSVSMLATGTYSIAVTDSNGCSVLTSITIAQTAAPTIALLAKTNAQCYNDSNGSITIGATGGNAPYSYLWNNGQTNSSASGLPAGTYTIELTDAASCIVTTTITITEPPKLQANINTTGSSVCYGQATTLTAIAGGGTPGYSYSWSNGNTTSICNVVTTTISSVTLTISDANGCTADTVKQLNINPLPTINFGADTLQGCEPLCVTFNNTTPNIQSLTWSFGDNTTSSLSNPRHCYSQFGNYNITLVVTDNNGCSNSLTKVNYITVHPSPVAAFSTSSNSVAINDAVSFFNHSTQSTYWQWNFGDAANAQSTIQNPSYIYPDSGTYRVQLIAKNEFGCSDTASENIQVKPEFTIYTPNTFTPNNDGKNDVFIPLGTGITVNNFELFIFDRWGDEIFRSTNLSYGWDGKANNGQFMAQQDTYVWKINLVDINGIKHRFVGHINLIR